MCKSTEDTSLQLNTYLRVQEQVLTQTHRHGHTREQVLSKFEWLY